MSQSLTAMEYLPVITAVAGATAGAAMAAHAHSQLAKRDAAVEAWSPDTFDTETEPSKARKFGRAALSGLAFAGLATGAANGIAWQEHTITSEVPASINVVVDGSGPTILGEEPAATQINLVIGQFVSEDFESKAFVASSGEVRVMNTEDASKVSPFGNAPMSQGVSLAFDASRGLSDTANAEQHATATVVVTNGNQIGNPAKVIEAAKATDEPVYIVNVEGSGDPAVNKGLEAIAEQTGGKYWDIETAADEDISSKIADTIAEATRDERTVGGNRLNKILAGISLAVMPIAYREARNKKLLPKGTK